MATEAIRAIQVLDDVRNWVESEAMTELLSLVSPAPTSNSSPWLHLQEHLPVWLTEGLAAGPKTDSDPAVALLRKVIECEQQAADAFNFRTQDGSTFRERSEATSADFDDATRSRIFALAADLGLVDPSRPKRDDYDVTLVLGGGYRSPLLRARYAAVLQREGVNLGQIYMLGSPRLLLTSEPQEKPVTAGYAPGATDEFGLLVAAAQEELGLSAHPAVFLCGCESATTLCPQWRYIENPGAAEVPPEYTHERAARLTTSKQEERGTVLSASTSRPPYRPDTADTLALWVAFAQPTASQRVLVVTTQVFVPFQRFDSLRQLFLPLGLSADVVGFGAEWGDRLLTAEYLLQETLSAIRSARRLAVQAVEAIRYNV